MQTQTPLRIRQLTNTKFHVSRITVNRHFMQADFIKHCNVLAEFP